MRNLTETTMQVSRSLAGLRKQCAIGARSLLAVLTTVIVSGMIETALGQPTMLDPNLSVRTVTTGLSMPTGIAFLAPNDFLVLEKETGRVQRVVDGVIQGPVLDLAVNFASERGLLGIALHPDFANNGFVYLYWTCRGAEAGEECNELLGADTGTLAEVPLLGNRVDRFVWDGSTLTFDQNIIRLHAYQADAEQPLRGNHNGGRIIFGPDGKLYIFIGDNGRRGQLQNLPDGPFGPGQPDDQFGGPEPDNAHLTGVILRLNDDGSTPENNPFFDVGAEIDGEVGANIQKIFSYGHRNSFGMSFDPQSGNLWLQENADDSFTEINLVEPGMNGGWVQIMGPVERIADFKAIETSMDIDPVTGTSYFGLQQIRWPPTLIADTPEEALSRLFMLPGAHYSDPKFSWKFEVAPAGIGFLNSSALGPEYEGNLFLGEARTFLADGYLFRFKLTEDRSDIAVEDPALEDRVADNNNKFDITESESLLIGMGFGVGTDIQTGPNGNLFVVSLSNGAIYEIFRIGGISDLAVTKTASADVVVPGSDLTYTITVTNNGPSGAVSVAAMDSLPDSTTFISCHATGGGVCEGADNSWTVNFPSLPVGASETVNFLVVVNDSLEDGTEISNTAIVSSATADPDLTNNSATATTIVSNPSSSIARARNRIGIRLIRR